MAVRTITIDMEAYERLTAHRRPGESFSQVIKRAFREQCCTAGALLASLDRVLVSPNTLMGADEAVRSRADEIVAEP